jgi:sec-independent protein translocase protein TatC
MQEEFAKISIIDHLEELRRRLIKTFLFFTVVLFVAYFFADDVYQILVEPLAEASHGEERKMIYTSLTEAFFTYLSLALFAAFFITFPFIAMQLYLFLAPGLYKREKQALVPFLIAAPILFLLGALMVYFIVMPLAWEFFLGFESNTGVPIKLEAKVDQYLSLVMHLIIGFGIAFQLPIVLTLLAKVGIVSAEGLKRNRRFAIVIIVVAAAFLTPPDVISQLALSAALYTLYEASIISCRLMVRKEPSSIAA